MATIKDIYIDAMDVDQSFKLKLSTFFVYFQDIANENAESLGIGKKAITDKGLDWVVMRMKAEFYSPIMFGETHELYTYPASIKSGFIYVRNAGMRRKDNKQQLAKLTSMWTLINHQTRKIQLHTNLPYFDEDFGDHPLELPNKIPAEPVEKLYSRTMRYSDCDLNGHVNNTRYIEMISDAFPLDFYMNHFITSIEINYSFEIHDSDKVDIYASKDKTYFECRVKDKIMFNAKLAYKSI